jgi:flagellum-specific peptidoglycan hydrolase FlgJ
MNINKNFIICHYFLLLISAYIFMPSPKQNPKLPPPKENTSKSSTSTNSKDKVYHTSPVPEGAQVVPCKTTTLSREEAKQYLKKAAEIIVGQPSREMISLLTAQWAIETANGDKMKNYNFGGIKGVSPESKQTTLYRTSEGHGKDKETIDDYFRAYQSFKEGAEDYVRLLNERLGSEIEYLINGDADNFVAALRRAKYFTGNPQEYRDNVASISRKLISDEEKQKQLKQYSNPMKNLNKEKNGHVIHLSELFFKKAVKI